MNGQTHAVIYTRGQVPVVYEGEQMIFDAIMMDPSGPHIILRQTSRINFGHIHTVQHNQLVCDQGVVSPESFDAFLAYWENVRDYF